MNRTALCIQMLQMLKSRGFLTRDEIATALQTNVRNIAEYRKELENAGYQIESTRGKYGGYALLSDCVLPSVSLNEDEIHALQETQTYFSSHPEFLLGETVNRAIDKVLSNTPLEEVHTGFYIENEQAVVSERVRAFIQSITKAIQSRHVVEISYRSLKDAKAKTFRIHPYEIINYKGAYYCIAYSLSARDYRTFKFSEERMKHCIALDQIFIRELDFDIKKHIGESGLVKDDVIEVVLELYDEVAVLTAEKQIGLHPSHTWINDTTLQYQTIFEGTKEATSFVMSLGAKAKVLQPRSLQEEIRAQAQLLLERYS